MECKLRNPEGKASLVYLRRPLEYGMLFLQQLFMILLKLPAQKAGKNQILWHVATRVLSTRVSTFFIGCSTAVWPTDSQSN